MTSQATKLAAVRSPNFGHLAEVAPLLVELGANERARAAAAYEDAAASMELASEVEDRLVAERAAHAAHVAAQELHYSEAETRLQIDQQLRDAGWEADSTGLRYSAGSRPAKGRNLAIAEWPTKSGPADYVLFTGLRPVAVVEAKRKRKNAAGAIEQAKRYSRDFSLSDEMTSPGGPWGSYQSPFLFSTNGRPFLRQLKAKAASGCSMGAAPPTTRAP